MRPTWTSLHVAGIITLASQPLCPGLPSPGASTPADPYATNTPNATVHVVRRCSVPIEVNGRLDESAWQQAQIVELVYEWAPGDNIPPPVRTEARVTYDRDNFYVSFRAFDPDPSRIRARLRDRDTGMEVDDNVGFMIDTFHDSRRAFEFMINPLGVQMDATWNEESGHEDFSWNAIWHAEGTIDEEGYVVEVAIPFSSIRFPHTDESQTWGIYFFRNWPREDLHRIRSIRVDRDVNGLIRFAGDLQGLQGITPGRNIELAPTLSSVRSDALTGDLLTGRMVSGDLKTEPGLTAKWGITPNLVFNATLNPDFNQVEADVAQLDVNRSFSIFYPERRPFFLEGADYFSMPMNAVVTRSVADPSAGLKLTGKEGRHSVGLFATRDRLNNLVFPGSQGNRSASFDEEVTTAVLRHRYDLGRNSTVGALYTGRFGSDYRNHVVGLDAFIRLTDSDSFGLQILRSETEYPDSVSVQYGQPAGSFGSFGMVGYFDHADRRWLLQTSFINKGRDLRADAGFITQVDIKGGSAVLLRRWWGEQGDWFRLLNVGLGTYQQYDQRDLRMAGDLSLFLDYGGPLQSHANLRLARTMSHYLGRDYEFSQAILNLSVRPNSTLAAGIESVGGGTVDYANARRGDQVTVSPWVTLNVGRRWYMSLSHNYQRLEVDAGKLFAVNLVQMRALYHFNVRTYARLILQYRSLERVVENYTFQVDRKNRSLFSQFLFSYKLNPQTVLYIGYSENSQGGEFGLSADQVDLTTTNRTIFLKLGYALVF